MILVIAVVVCTNKPCAISEAGTCVLWSTMTSFYDSLTPPYLLLPAVVMPSLPTSTTQVINKNSERKLKMRPADQIQIHKPDPGQQTAATPTFCDTMHTAQLVHKCLVCAVTLWQIKSWLPDCEVLGYPSGKNLPLKATSSHLGTDWWCQQMCDRKGWDGKTCSAIMATAHVGQ